jgi:hypothetical protein
MSFSVKELVMLTAQHCMAVSLWRGKNCISEQKCVALFYSVLHKDYFVTTKFGPKKDKVTGVWKKLHNEELHDLYSSPTIVRVIKSRRMRWVGHVAWMGEGRGMYRVLVGKLRERDHWGDPGVDGRRWVSGMWGYGLDWADSE